MTEEDFEKAKKIQKQIEVCDKINLSKGSINFYDLLLVMPDFFDTIKEKKKELEKEFEEL